MNKMGWKLKHGEYQEGFISDDELWKVFNDFFSDKTVKNTGYKFIFFYALLSNLENFDDLYSIAYTKVFEIFTETYWDLYIIHGKRQSRINQPSKAEKIFDEYVQTKLGQREFNKFNHMEKDEIVKTKRSKEFVIIM